MEHFPSYKNLLTTTLGSGTDATKGERSIPNARILAKANPPREGEGPGNQVISVSSLILKPFPKPCTIPLQTLVYIRVQSLTIDEGHI